MWLDLVPVPITIETSRKKGLIRYEHSDIRHKEE